MALNNSTNLRSSDEYVYLIGKCEKEIVGYKLPSKLQVLKCFFYYTRCENKTIKESGKLVLEEILPFWNRSRIPTLHERTCAEKLKKLYDEWRTVQKGYKSQSNHKKENDFKQSLNNLFDIAHSDALTMISIQEDRDFLIKQREPGRVGRMTSVDQSLANKEKRKAQRIEEESLRKEKYQKRESTQDFTVECDISVESECESEKSEEPLIIVANINKPIKKRGKQTFINDRMLACMDAGNMSTPLAIHFISATAKALGHNIEDLVLNCTSLKKQRKEYRKRHGKDIIKNFKIPDTFVLHWDGKLLPAIAGKEKVDRLAIVLTAENVDKLIAIPIIDVGSGAAIAQSIYDYLLKINFLNSLEMVCFDTTATNTGQHNGAGMLLEQKLERSLLWLPCRHHIAEILLRAVFEIYFGKSSGPEVVVFERFSREWNTFNLKDFNIGMMDEEVKRAISFEECEASKDFCIEYLAKHHIRHDYKELLELTFIFLGGNIPNFSFRAPGATSHARFMSKAIYALKMFALHKQFKMSSSQLNGFRNVCIFLVRLYVPYWFKTTNAAEAPNKDLELIKNIARYIDPQISLCLLTKMRNHLWYLSEEAVALAFFDTNVNFNVKKKMVLALKLGNDVESNEDNDVSLPKKVCANIEEMKEFTSKDLSCFVTERTKKFFSRLEIDMDFLNIDPSKWYDNAEYRKGIQILKNITVVNDPAERKVKLITDFNRSLTHSEEDRQYLLHVVENYRQEFPSYTKSSLL